MHLATYKAKELSQAKRIAHQYLSLESLPTFATEQLEEILQVIRYEETRAKSGVQFIEGEVLVSVSGGEVLYGAAPLELVLDKVERIRNIFYRTTELLLDLELRKRGGPNQLVKAQCNPWLLQAAPGSYQFAVRIRKPQQQLTIPGLPDAELRVEQITQKFFSILKATTRGSEAELAEVVPREEYRETFLKLTRELAPPATGKSFSQMEIKSTSDIEPSPVILSPDTRQAIKSILKGSEVSSHELLEYKPAQLRGILRGLQLDNDWIQVSINGENKIVYDAREEIDDVIGPMVNRRVVVEVVEQSNKSLEKRYLLRDIQLEEDLL